MAEVNPPLYLPVDLFYGADELALPWRDIIGEGVIKAAHLAVSQRAAGANKSVDVAAGGCWIAGDDNIDAQGAYRCRSDSIINKAIADNASGNPRIDRIIARVYDATFAGAQNIWAVEVLQGAPTAGATKENALGAAAIPNNAIELARVQANNGFATITNAEILDMRARATIGLGDALVSAGVVVATTVAGLGAGVAGKVGHLRIGASPYDFVVLTYDVLLGKWVSEIEHFDLDDLNSRGVTSNAYQNPPYSIYTLPRLSHFKRLYDAGLRPQFRFNTILYHGVVGQTAYAALRLVEVNAADTFTTAVDTAPSWLTSEFCEVARVGSNDSMQVSGWEQPALTAPVKDHAVIRIRQKSSDNANNAWTYNPQIEVRWVG